MKEIKYHVALKSTEHPHRYPNDTVYTNDRESVQFVFTLTDFQNTELSSATAKIYLFMKNGSMYQEDATVNSGEQQVTYTLQGNQGKHYGQNRVQIELIIGGRTYASPVYYYTINPGLETQVAQEVMIKDWTTLTVQARAWLDDAEADEEARKVAEQERVLAEGQRQGDYIDWQDGAVKLENLIENGDFSNGITGWHNYLTGTSRQVSDGWLQIGQSTTAGGGVYQNLSRTPGHIYYHSYSVRAIAPTKQFSIVGVSPTVSNVSTDTSLGSVIRMSIVHTGLVYIGGRSEGDVPGYFMEMSQPIAIDLTEAFGAGNEPTKEEMDELIRLIGWFDGEINLSQKQVAIWTLNMIRKNRNAIVALGGTIA